jgi:hypothetical protein
MNGEEIDIFINFAKDSETGQIDWKQYVKATMEILWKGQ